MVELVELIANSGDPDQKHPSAASVCVYIYVCVFERERGREAGREEEREYVKFNSTQISFYETACLLTI